MRQPAVQQAIGQVFVEAVPVEDVSQYISINTGSRRGQALTCSLPSRCSRRPGVAGGNTDLSAAARNRRSPSDRATGAAHRQPTPIYTLPAANRPVDMVVAATRTGILVIWPTAYHELTLSPTMPDAELTSPIRQVSVRLQDRPSWAGRARRRRSTGSPLPLRSRGAGLGWVRTLRRATGSRRARRRRATYHRPTAVLPVPARIPRSIGYPTRGDEPVPTRYILRQHEGFQQLLGIYRPRATRHGVVDTYSWAPRSDFLVSARYGILLVPSARMVLCNQP
jgi:hypothetical protein